MNYYLNRKPVNRFLALAKVLKAWEGEPSKQTVELFETAHEQSTDGYIARDMIEDRCDGLKMRHLNEEQS